MSDDTAAPILRPVGWTEALTGAMRAQAVGAGFDLAGVAPCPSAEEPAGESTAAQFSAWIAGGNAGEMEYLKRRDAHGDLLRASARTALPWARSIVVCAMNYNAEGPLSIDGPEQTATVRGWIARYAWMGDLKGNPTDYHDDLMGRLQRVEVWLHGAAECQTRCYVDTGPLLEREFAARAGIGWIGKNTCVLNQQLGSWLLLGVIVTSIPVDVALDVAADRCGSCTRCIDACPADALRLPTEAHPERAMDASVCISYLTIEKKGAIPEELRARMGRQVFGCDICQEVCPWNRRAPIAQKDGLRTRPELIDPSLEWLAELDREGFKRAFAGSPLERTKLGRLQRNVAIAIGNSGDPSFRPALERWRSGEDAVLAEAATWALTRLASGDGASASISESENPGARDDGGVGSRVSRQE